MQMQAYTRPVEEKYGRPLVSKGGDSREAIHHDPAAES